jgi:quercetin dioxygenase-like cupin family protein
MSTFRRFSGYRWEGIADGGYAGVRQPLGGGAFQGTRKFIVFGREEGISFQQRYFEVDPGGYTRLEKHGHTHCVLGLRGRGVLIMGEEVFQIGFMDAAYIAPGVPHQLVNETNEPFGFFCTVDKARDAPAPLEGAELAAVLCHPVTGPHARAAAPGSGGPAAGSP